MSEESKKEEIKEPKQEEENKPEKKEEVKTTNKEEGKPVPAEKAKKEEKKEKVAEEKKEVEVPKKFKKLVEEIEQMSVIDLSELVKILEEKFGVSASASTIVAAAPGAVAGEGEEDAKSSFDVIMTGVGEKKIEVIKALRDITGKGLKDSKDIADKTVHDPQVIKEGAGKEDAEEIKKKLEGAGASVELK
jgi:large subunit ribosomal protein L7/L12